MYNPFTTVLNLDFYFFSQLNDRDKIDILDIVCKYQKLFMISKTKLLKESTSIKKML